MFNVRNLTIEHLNINFVATRKLTPSHSFDAGKVFMSCVWLIPVSRVRATSKPFRYQYFAAWPFKFKVFNHIGYRWYFQLVEKKKIFAWENEKEVVEGLGTSSFVTVNNLSRHICGCGEILLAKIFLTTYMNWCHV